MKDKDMEIKTVSVTVKLMQEIVNYLDTRPHKEVSILIADILRECNQPKEKAVEPEKSEA